MVPNVEDQLKLKVNMEFDSLFNNSYANRRRIREYSSKNGNGGEGLVRKEFVSCKPC